MRKVDGGSGRRDPVRNITADSVRRSTSMHTQKGDLFRLDLCLLLIHVFSEFENKSGKNVKDEALAQLIADSTEKKFKFNNLFKGIWKKKQYSFDLG